ncbi:MAG: polyprenyl synthetase family protein [PVC group bacterium]|nr:polyprenyl synthetase family protein [PVC group bacterium]
MEIITYLDNTQNDIDRALDEYLQPKAGIPKILIEAMRYSIFAGGKRLRPALLCIATGQIIGGKAEMLMPVACAIELIYTGFFIHEDLPATGNRDYRYGKLTNHKVYGENMAVVAGDCLLSSAFALVSNGYKEATLALHLMQELSKSIGMTGLIAGQVVDMFSRGKFMDKDVLEYICSHKTGELINVAVKSGAIVSGANENELEALTTYAKNIAIAVQIFDDLLDAAEFKKKISTVTDEDKKQRKMSYVAVHGQRKVRKMARKKISLAKNSVGALESPGLLCQLADFICDSSSPI